jgi:class 3 adenylate cyclase
MDGPDMEAPHLERKLIAILAADIEGYSRLMSIDEVATLATLSAHRTVADALIAQHGGRICNTAGDSVLAEFSSVFAAVQCAVEIQRDLALANQKLTDDRRMWFRIGINVGDVMVKDGDIFGDGVNIAARIEGLAEAGGSCISRGVRDHIRRKLPYGFEDLGEQSVKNIAQSIRGLPPAARSAAAGGSGKPCGAGGRTSRRAHGRPLQRRDGGRRASRRGTRVLGVDQGEHPPRRLRGLSRAISRGKLRAACPHAAGRVLSLKHIT